jgi:lipoprotein-anchoring transpeptidase ErfK/SrfK
MVNEVNAPKAARAHISAAIHGELGRCEEPEDIELMLRSRLSTAASLALGLLFIEGSQSFAQYYYYPYAPSPQYASPYGRGEYTQPYYAPPFDDEYAPSARRPSKRARTDDYYEGGAAPRRAGPQIAALPPEADPAYSTPLDLDQEVDLNQTTAAMVDDPTSGRANTITIDTAKRKLYLSLGDGRAIEYGVGVGREGFAWKGQAEIGRKAFWPGWTPPREMLLRRPDLPRHMEGGIDNPLGARALYLFKGEKDTMFRIHGTNEPDTIGHAVSSGCIRMLNADVIDLFNRVKKGARVVVL